jgi:hypothetical protein
VRGQHASILFWRVFCHEELALWLLATDVIQHSTLESLRKQTTDMRDKRDETYPEVEFLIEVSTRECALYGKMCTSEYPYGKGEKRLAFGTVVMQ